MNIVGVMMGFYDVVDGGLWYGRWWKVVKGVKLGEKLGEGTLWFYNVLDLKIIGFFFWTED